MISNCREYTWPHEPVYVYGPPGLEVRLIVPVKVLCTLIISSLRHLTRRFNVRNDIVRDVTDDHK